MQKYLIIGVVVVGILVGGYFVLNNYAYNEKQASEPTIDTSGWQTYLNNELGFEFKYPDDFQIEEYSPSETDSTLALISQEGVLPGAGFQVFVDVGEISHPEIVGLINPVELQANIIRKNTVVINGREWQKTEEEIFPVEGIGMSGYRVAFYTTPTFGGLIYVLHCNNCDEGAFGEPGREEKEFLNQVLSTFRFIE